MQRWIFVAALGAVACGKPPAEAPAELDDLSSYLFQHYDDEETEELVAGLVGIQAFLETQPLDGDVKDRAYTLSVLDGELLDGLPVPAGVDTAKQVPVAVAAASVHGIGDQLIAITEPNQICIESETTKYAGRTFLSDVDCFVDGSCDTLQTKTEVRKENILAKVWFEQFKDYRRLELEDGTEVMIARSWMEEQFPADGGNNSWDQLYQVDVFVPSAADSSKMLRYLAMWSSVTLGGIGDDTYSGLVRDGIAEAYVFTDEFIAGDIQSCKNDRDRAYDRE